MHPLDTYKQRSYAAMGLRPFRGLQGLGLVPAEPILKEEAPDVPALAVEPTLEIKEEISVQPLPLPLPEPPTGSIYVEQPVTAIPPLLAPPPPVPKDTFVQPPPGTPAPSPLTLPPPPPSVTTEELTSVPTPALIPTPPTVETVAVMAPAQPGIPWLWIGGGAAALVVLYMLTRR